MANIPMVIFLVSLFGLGRVNAIDSKFCDEHMEDNKDPSGNRNFPMVPDRFSIVIEQSQIGAKQVVNIEEDYSAPRGRFHVKVKAFHNVSEDWFDVTADENLHTRTVGGGGFATVCTAYSIDDSPMAKVLHVHTETDAGTTLSNPDVILHLRTSRMARPIYTGQGVTRADIPTETWQVCQYNEDTQTTAVVTLHFGHVTTTKAGTPGAPLAATFVAVSEDASHPKPFRFRYDYVNMEGLQYENLNRLVPPPNIFCSQENPAHDLPEMPHTFQYKTEIAHLGDPHEANKFVTLEIRSSAYLEAYGLLVYDIMTQAENPYGVMDRIIHDYKLGLLYLINRDEDTCFVSPFDHDEGSLADNFKDPRNFYSMGTAYRHHGHRLKAMRGIDCDVYVSREDGNTVTWYFATKNWMLNVMNYEKYAPLPIAFEMLGNNSHLLFNVFEYTPDPTDRNPDYSMCFSEDDSVNMLIVLKGARYDVAYLGHATSFKDQFVSAAMLNGEFATPTRVVMPVDPRPGHTDEIYVRFTLLGNPKLHGDGGYSNTDHYPSAQRVRDSLEKRINLGAFHFRVKDEQSGSTIATLVAERLVSLDEAFYSSLPSADSASGFTGGVMGGVAIGLLVVGFLVGVVGVVIFSRTRGLTGAKDSSVRMDSIDEESK